MAWMADGNGAAINCWQDAVDGTSNIITSGANSYQGAQEKNNTPKAIQHLVIYTLIIQTQE
jgi:hypothetical protein